MRWILTFVLISALLRTTAQVKVPGIPYPMRWENTPTHFEVRGNTFVMKAGAKTDMFRDPNVTYNTDNAPKLLFTPDDDFVLTASIEHAFAAKWDGGALVLKKDSLNWVKFCYEQDYTGAHRVVTVVTKNISDDCNSVSLAGNKVFYKMAKAGPVVTLYYSANNRDWLLVRHFQMEGNGPWSVGFLAQSPTGNECTVAFGDVRYEKKKIKDPYVGE